jgi:hypothetical protein
MKPAVSHTHLTKAAKAASRAKGTYPSAQYTRLKGRRGHAKATIALAHSILTASPSSRQPRRKRLAYADRVGQVIWPVEISAYGRVGRF